ncbi:MAG: MarC family protein [Nitrospirae bacterium]|nr:MarC family protein [Nitrospirota bacterium]
METWFDGRLVSEFVTYFVVLDPLGMAPLFWALTHKGSRPYQVRMALMGVGLATAMLLLFAFTGKGILLTFGISMPAFRIAGGLLLFLLSIDMIFARQSGLRSTTVREQEEAAHREGIAVFPLAFPLIAGPGALTTVLLFSERPQGLVAALPSLVVMLVVLGMLLGCLLAADTLMRRLGETGANVVSRVLGLILAALSVQYVIDGIRDSLLP